MVKVCLFALLCLAACSTTSLEPLAEPDQRAEIVWPKPPDSPRIKFVNMFQNADDLGLHKSFSQKIGKFFVGQDERGMDRPYAIAVNTNLTAVADPSLGVVHLFDRKRNSYRLLRKVGEQLLATPIGVVLGGNKLYVADSELQKVFVLNSHFRLVMTLEGFKRPTSLAYDPVLNRLYVTDTLEHKIRVFDQNGEFLYEIGGRGLQDGQLNYPSHVTFAKNRLFVNDTMNFRVQIFNQDGQHLSTFGEKGNGLGFFIQPKGIAVDSEGHIYVADAIANHIQIFDQNGKLLLNFGQAGNGPGEFQMPTGLAIWNDTIYVADSYNHRVQVFQYLPEDY
jgi:DNA-binding beta-propeller fold protein YncE